MLQIQSSLCDFPIRAAADAHTRLREREPLRKHFASYIASLGELQFPHTHLATVKFGTELDR